MTLHQPKQPPHPSRSVMPVFLRLFGIGLIGVSVLCSLLLIRFGGQALTTLQALKPWLACWRLTVFAVLIGGWPYWVQFCAVWLQLTPGQQARLSKDRWRFALVLLLVELVLVQRGLLVLFSGV